MRQTAWILAFLALSCNSPNDPECQNFFGTSSFANVTVTKIAGTCTVLHATRVNLPMTQTRCNFSSTRPLVDDPAIGGAITSDGHVEMTYEANGIGCLVAGTGLILGKTITATLSPPTPAPCGCILTLIITKQ